MDSLPTELSGKPIPDLLKWKSFNRVRLFVTPWTSLYSPWNSPGQNIGVGSLSQPFQAFYQSNKSKPREDISWFTSFFFCVFLYFFYYYYYFFFLATCRLSLGAEWRLLFVAVSGLILAVASLVTEFWVCSVVVLEKAMETHSSTLAWKIPWMEQPGRLQSMGSRRVGHDWATSFSLFTFMHWRRKGQPTPVFLPGESQGHRVWWAAVYAVAQSWTRLKRLSSSSSSSSCAAAQGMWNLPGAGIMSLALAGGFLTTRPPGKTLIFFFFFYDSNVSCM